MAPEDTIEPEKCPTKIYKSYWNRTNLLATVYKNNKTSILLFSEHNIRYNRKLSIVYNKEIDANEN